MITEDADGKLLCPRCEEWVDKSKFANGGRSTRGRCHTMCNKCVYWTYSRPKLDRKYAAVNEYKLAQGCADCGYAEHPAALDFDHLPGSVKSFNVAEKVGSYSWERLWLEIEKCEVVCANCHRIRSVNRRKETKGVK